MAETQRKFLAPHREGGQQQVVIYHPLIHKMTLSWNKAIGWFIMYLVWINRAAPCKTSNMQSLCTTTLSFLSIHCMFCNVLQKISILFLCQSFVLFFSDFCLDCFFFKLRKRWNVFHFKTFSAMNESLHLYRSVVIFRLMADFAIADWAILSVSTELFAARRTSHTSVWVLKQPVDQKNTGRLRASHRTSAGNIQAGPEQTSSNKWVLWFAEINTPFSPPLPFPSSCTHRSHTILYGTNKLRISSSFLPHFLPPTLFLYTSFLCVWGLTLRTKRWGGKCCNCTVPLKCQENLMKLMSQRQVSSLKLWSMLCYVRCPVAGDIHLQVGPFCWVIVSLVMCCMHMHLRAIDSCDAACLQGSALWSSYFSLLVTFRKARWNLSYFVYVTAKPLSVHAYLCHSWKPETASTGSTPAGLTEARAKVCLFFWTVCFLLAFWQDAWLFTTYRK